MCVLSTSGCEDEDGVRSVGSTQLDDFESHRHADSNATDAAGNGNNSNFTHSGAGGSKTIYTDYTGGDETRPRNVALLYCEKD